MGASKRCRASARLMSGPIPAGSPEVTAMGEAPSATARPARDPALCSAVFKPVLDVGAVAQLAQPLLVGFVALALAPHLACLETLAFRRGVGGASLEDLDQVPAEGRLDRLADFSVLQMGVGALELRNGVTGKNPPELSAARRRGVVRMEPRKLGEIRAVRDALAQLSKLALRVVFGDDLVRAHENVPQVDLLHLAQRRRPAAIDELEHVEARRAAQYVGHVAGLQLGEGLDEKLGQTV